MLSRSQKDGEFPLASPRDHPHAPLSAGNFSAYPCSCHPLVSEVWA